MKALDIAGQRFDRLVAIKRVGATKEGVVWSFTCDCGGSLEVAAKRVKSGNTKSCGCLTKDVVVARNKAAATHGMTNSPTWVSWMLMTQRCENPNHKSFKDYGGRGITICKRWKSFENFYADMGLRPKETTLDRIDTDGNYEPENCRWSNLIDQANNRRSSVFVEYDGRSQTLAQWAKELGVSRQTLRYRLNNGWSIEDSIKQAVSHGNCWKVRRKT